MSRTPPKARRSTPALGVAALGAISSAALIAALGTTLLGRTASAQAAGVRSARHAGAPAPVAATLARAEAARAHAVRDRHAHDRRAGGHSADAHGRRRHRHGHGGTKGHASKRRGGARKRGGAHGGRAGRDHSRAAAERRGRRSSRPRHAGEADQLWATIDVCRMAARPMIGVRASMPPNGHPRDTMYARLRLQYLDAASGGWRSLEGSASAGFVKLGAANTTRQTGRTFQLSPQPEAGAFELRGLVEFQWRRHGSVVAVATRPTTSGHHNSKAGAVPPGFSAATCTLE